MEIARYLYKDKIGFGIVKGEKLLVLKDSIYDKIEKKPNISKGKNGFYYVTLYNRDISDLKKLYGIIEEK